MNYSWITLRDIEYLLAVAKFEHFAKAAAACRVSQPALSAQIKKFETQLGVEIFERTNRRVQVTEKGREILGQAQRLVDESLILLEKAKSQTEPLSGPLRLGAIATIGPYLFPEILALLRKKFPACELFIEEGLTDGLLQKLSEGELDMVIAADTFSDDQFIKHKLYFEKFVAAIPKGHKFEQRKILSSKDLDAREMVLLKDGHCLSDQVLQLCSKGKGAKRESFQTTSLETLRYLVASGSGYSLFPEKAVRPDNQLKTLITYLPLEGRVGREVILVTRKSYSRYQNVRALISLFS